jgi:hypothetical protein
MELMAECQWLHQSIFCKLKARNYSRFGVIQFCFKILTIEFSSRRKDALPGSSELVECSFLEVSCSSEAPLSLFPSTPSGYWLQSLLKAFSSARDPRQRPRSGRARLHCTPQKTTKILQFTRYQIGKLLPGLASWPLPQLSTFNRFHNGPYLCHELQAYADRILVPRPWIMLTLPASYPIPHPPLILASHEVARQAAVICLGISVTYASLGPSSRLPS